MNILNKSYIIIILTITVFTQGCHSSDNIKVEQLAIDYFTDSILTNKIFPYKNIKLYSDGKVSGISNPIMYSFEDSIRTLEKLKASKYYNGFINASNNNFSIKIPSPIIDIKSDKDFTLPNISMHYFVTVRNNIKGENGNSLVEIFLFNKDRNECIIINIEIEKIDQNLLKVKSWKYDEPILFHGYVVDEHKGIIKIK